MIKKPIAKGKTMRKWLNAAYKENKEIIDKVYARTAKVILGKETTKQAFVRDLKQTAEMYNYGSNFAALRKSFDKLSREGDFMSTQERAYRNLAGLPSNLGNNALKNFQNLIRDESGRFTKFDPDKMLWDKKNGVWIYDNKIIIDYRNSPQEVVIRSIA